MRERQERVLFANVDVFFLAFRRFAQVYNVGVKLSENGALISIRSMEIIRSKNLEVSFFFPFPNA